MNAAVSRLPVWLIHVPRTFARRPHAAFHADDETEFSGRRDLHGRRCSLIARATVRRLAAPRIGCPPGALRFARDRFGKPHLAPRTDGTDFSIAHSGEWVCVSLASTSIGVDIEQREPGLAVSDLWTMAMSDTDRNHLAELDFFDLWVMKESVVKADGRGLSIPLRSVHFSRLPGRELRYTARIPDVEQTYFVSVGRPLESYSAAVATPREDAVPDFLHWNFGH